jgi:hypothetical protein
VAAARASIGHVHSLARERSAAALAVLIAILVQLVIPARMVIGPVLLVPAVEAVLLVTLLVGRLRTDDPHHGGLRAVSLVLVSLLVVANVAAALRLVTLILSGQGAATSAELVRAGLGIWVTNVIAFAILFWELDLGGPARRTLPPPEPVAPDVPDFLFPQYDSTRTPSDWLPGFADYLYTSFTNATAFSPTDAMPTGYRAKAMMALQSAVALVTMAFLLARAVNILQ